MRSFPKGRIIALLSCALAAAMAVGAFAQKKDAEKPPAKPKKEDTKKIKLEITGIKYNLTQESSAVLGHKGTQILDPSKQPKATDVTVTEGPDKGKTFLGIYELTADDFKVCFAAPGKARPTEFTAKEGSGQLLQLWRREKK